MPDAFGRAIRDHHRDERTDPLWQCDGEERADHPIERYYFDDADGATLDFRDRWVDGPLLDLGAGAGRDARHFQERFETVAIEVSDALVETMRDRGVEDARRGDMFALREQFAAGRFASAIAVGSQVSLAGSMDGLEKFLADLAHVTTDDATFVFSAYDPTAEGVEALLGYRPDEAAGLAHRVTWFEYGDHVDPVLYFRLFSVDRLREAAAATGWTVAEVIHPHRPSEYRAALRKIDAVDGPPA